MQADKADALVLRVIDFSETSCVVTLFTRQFGKIRGLAKGARRLKGPFESALDLLSECRIVFLRKSSEALDLLTEAKLLRRFRPAGRDLSRLYAAYYVAELLEELTHDDDPHPEVFDAAVSALAQLSRAEPPVGACVVRFELTLLRLLGHLPSLDRCVECGAEIKNSVRVHFGVSAGGVLCARCRPYKKHVVNVAATTLAALDRLASAEASEPPTVDRRTLGEIRGVLNQYIAHLVGRRPRMHSYLGYLVN